MALNELTAGKIRKSMRRFDDYAADLLEADMHTFEDRLNIPALAFRVAETHRCGEPRYWLKILAESSNAGPFDVSDQASVNSLNLWPSGDFAMTIFKMIRAPL